MTILLDPDPNALAEKLTGRPYISYSAISTYQQCPLRYYFRYIEGLPEETVSASLVFGGAIHQAAEFHFRELMVGNPPPDLDTLLSVYQDAWSERDIDAVQFAKNENVNTLGQLAERVLIAFQESDFARPTGDILGVEEELRGSIQEDCPELLARVDLIVDTDDELIVTDLKTARSRWSRDQVDSAADQVLLYSELAKELAPTMSLRLQFAVITKTKQPVLELHTVACDPGRLKRTKQVVRQVWRAIESRHFYPAPSTMSCPSCPFREACRMWCG